MQTHVYMAEGIPPKPEPVCDMTVNSSGFSVAVDAVQHIEAFGLGIRC